MDDNSKIVIQARHGGAKHKVEHVERSGISMFSAQMSTLVGPAYVGAFGTGIVWGAS